MTETREDQPMFWAPSLTFLRAASRAILCGALGVLLTILLVIPDQPLRAVGPALLAVVATISLRQLRAGRVRAALAVLVWGTWLTVIGITAFFGGVRGLLVIVYPLLILTGGWLLGPRTAVVIAALTVAAIVGFVAGDLWAWLPPRPPTPALMFGVVQTAAVVVAALLIIHLVGSYRSRIDEVRQLGRDLAQRTAELQASEADLNRAQGVAHVGSWIYDLIGGRIEMSAETCRIFGLPEGVTGDMQSFLAIVHPDDRAALKQASDSALHGDTFDIELRIVVDRAVRWIVLRAEVEFDVDERPVRSVGTAQDVTARKELEASLRDQREFFRLISESIGEHIAVLDLEGRRLYNSPSYRQFFGDARNLRGSDSFADVHPEDRDLVQRVFHETAQSGVGQEIEYRLVRRDGSVRHMSSSGKVIRDSEGQPVRIVVVSHDITDRKHAEQWERIAATAFESQQGMFITDAFGIILRVNQAFTEITGYSAEEAVGRNPSLLRSGRHDATFYAEMRESLERTGAWQGEIWNRRKSDEIYPEWLTISAVTDSDGRVTHYVATLTDLTMRKAAQEEIRHLAFYDALTGLPNRRLLHERLRLAMATSARRGRQGALLFIDLDNFKTLNDTLGHEKGDLLLQQAARRLSDCIRSRDTVARLGGDEFVVMLEDLGERIDEAVTQSRIVGEKILAVLNRPYDLAGHEYHNTPSVGITLFSGERDALDELMKRADLAMYEAKATGRNTLRFFDPQMQAVVTARAALEKNLREALQRREFFLCYQPQVDGSGCVVGVEALVRWKHPQRGLVSPAEFIPLAEETGLILPLGLWVLETACAQVAVWAECPGRERLTVSVNVSARQLRQANFVEQVLGVLASSGANPHNLKLELTESMLLDNVQEIIAKMSALKDRGVCFSLDDFGTGYSSLSYLKKLPLDQLKIDQSFVRDLLTDPNDEVIARTIVALASSLGLAVIAEGVESVAQRDLLKAQGCDAYQGYLFSPPLVAADLERFLDAQQARAGG
ncbi:EAL domain-containing protein [Accumulibacter sp.]|uniref:EAL domain-containing protein n=1 Tax=Accumulibacter sp. TaxID=2053492 RepID=UPI0025ECF1BC|nr:EAL domain-containing protein [Accumulibacter sp.]MCM8596962.1 EAL domain-containing protein [Accumulibacter sp.]MCM8624456.1 EAL domain-containing protein [Accumulibacter sp.]MDS4051111.1 EAL domain-containing protein [Accumulibacter sp.]